jgi:AraC-like DNA-binding protein
MAMTTMPNEMTGTPELAAGSVELLADVLQRVRLAGSIFLFGEFSAPWGFSSTDAATLASVVAPGAKRLVLLHLAVEGRFRISLPSGESAHCEAGDAIVLPYCDVHSMADPPETAPVPIVDLLPPPPWTTLPVRCESRGGGAPTRVLCGYLSCDDLLFNPLLGALPRLIHVRPSSGPAAQWREASLRYTVEQAALGGGGALLARLPELVLADCLRQYAESAPPAQRGWLTALRDPVVGRALVLLHARPADPWTVTELARRAAVSRSLLAERFTRALGVSPMRYLMQWRLQLAAELLRSSRIGLAPLAERVGYESEAAFSRAFKRHLGLSPAAWRERSA